MILFLQYLTLQAYMHKGGVCLRYEEFPFEDYQKYIPGQNYSTLFKPLTLVPKLDTYAYRGSTTFILQSVQYIHICKEIN